ncbi:hypothetical protein P3T76_007400 [Phytophthora citrophthora]|uniref:Uncharacterized protein n=1 Tax=Phytophthora citrophthora TaxID=4793 RepID=A0AAD9GMF6_9STRA|nr:hypothetical protein P3T76_007400 [Phytophthora citrophthora]
MLQSVSPPLLNEEVIEIEQFRARHRRLLRTRQQQIPATVESLDEDDGRRRKISSKWRQKQKKSQQNDNWSQPVSSFNAFDFSTSPETFCDVVEAPCAAFQDEQRMAEAARQVASMGFHCTNMWQGMDDWVPNTKPTYYSTCSDQRRTLYQPQNYA